MVFGGLLVNNCEIANHILVLVKISWGIRVFVLGKLEERVLVCPTFSRSRCSQVQIISGAALRVQVRGRNPALFFNSADKPPAYKKTSRRYYFSPNIVFRER